MRPLTAPVPRPSPCREDTLTHTVAFDEDRCCFRRDSSGPDSITCLFICLI